MGFLNPDVNVVPYNMRLSEDNIIDLFNEYDLVVDGCDNFATRYLVNDAAVLTNTTIVHGSIFQFEGQGYRPQAPRGTVLSVHVSNSTATRHGARLKRGWRPGRAPGHNWSCDGNRSGQTVARHWRTAYWSFDDV